MSESLPFHSSSSKSLTSIPQASLHTCEPCGTSCQQMAESQIKEGRDTDFTQEENNTFSMKKRYTVDEDNRSSAGPVPGPGVTDSEGFHLYHQQFSDASSMANSFQELPVKPSSFLSQSCPSYNSSFSPSQQVSFRKYHHNDQCNRSKYSIPTQSYQESTMQSLFPKPIYSYSVLIFMALRNSKTGSLPVSEIYSFMTEHFPYFKTAPDGWKNSVRHNLSLNKCFVKIENKNGNSSRKGCLWSLNPAKVEKMQDELHKWRRKDPITVRRSMARPESLDRLLGERPRYSSTALLSRVAPVYSSTSSPCTQTHLQHTSFSLLHPYYAHIPPQQPGYLPTATVHPNNSFTLYSSCGQPTAPGNMNSPMVGKMAPVYRAALQTEYSLGPRSMQDFLLEGDANYDIDTLNPSLTDLQLQGNLWEELREDSLVSDSQFTSRTPPPMVLEGLYVQTTCPQATPPSVGR
ncbi:forkhead box protein N1 [Antennarius striatus]|uniref:forkhead box protein N1 n=1 Tax=Antennarius striatus TaxID=241820 RepID=UPI0035B04082